MLLRTLVNRVSVEIDLPGVERKTYDEVRSLLESTLSGPEGKVKHRDAIFKIQSKAGSGHPGKPWNCSWSSGISPC